MNDEMMSALDSIESQFHIENMKNGIKITILLNEKRKKIAMITIPQDDNDFLFTMFLNREMIVAETFKKDEIVEFVKKLKFIKE